MKKVLILIIAISLFAVLSKAIATTNDYDEIAKSDKVGVTIYAKKMNGLYVGFVETGAIWDGQTGDNWNAERKDIEYTEVGARLGLA